MPKTKTLYNSNNAHIHFVDRSDEVKKTLINLSKTALRESAKVIRKELRKNVPLRTKRFKNHIGSWVMINYKTGQPTLQIGFYSWQKVKKRGKKPSHAAPWWVEFGTKPHELAPKQAKIMTDGINYYGAHVAHPGQAETHVLRNTALNTLGEVRERQKKYLAEISKTLEEAGMKVQQGDEFEDDD